MNPTVTNSRYESMHIPKEITINILCSQESSTQNRVGQNEKPSSSNHNPSFSISNMIWENQEDSNMSDPTGYIGCVVSLQSSDCSSQESNVDIKPLDYRKDWTKELETDLTQCLTQNLDLFMATSEQIISDENSLCSCLSEDYEMEYDVNMIGLWDGEKSDISIPDWITKK